jgi:hypothetical protein
MKEADRKKVEEIMAGMKCPHDFKCAEAGFEHLCKAKSIGPDGFLECLDENHASCAFAYSFGEVPLCLCPLRVYMAKKFKI